MKILKSSTFYFSLFIIGVVISWWVLFESECFTDKNISIGFFIATIGLLFSFMQFRIHLINRKNDYLRDIRYNEYQRLRKLINDFSNLINENMMNDPNPFKLENVLVNLRNEISEIIKINNKQIFKKIQEKDAVKEFDKITSKIVLNASDYRKKFEETQNNKKVKELQKDSKQYDIVFELKNFAINQSWHNETVTLLQDYYKWKGRMLEEIQNYLID